MELSPPLSQYVESLYASLFFSTIMTTAFYGITCMQSFYYYIHYQDDSLRIKLLVATLWGLDTIHEALTVSGTYKFILIGLTSPLSLLNAIPEFMIQLLTTALAAVLAQSYFIYRIYAVSGRKNLPVLVWAILGCYQLLATIFYLAKALYFSQGTLQVISVTTLHGKFFTTISTSVLSIAAGVDIIIAISLTYILLQKRTASSFSSTAHILQRLIWFSVNTGSWTALFALLAVILLHVFPTTMINALFSIPLCSIYCNTVLANLNARQYIRGEATEDNADSEQATGSRGTTFIMMPTDRQKMFRSSAPVAQRNPVSFHPVTVRDLGLGKRSVSCDGFNKI